TVWLEVRALRAHHPASSTLIARHFEAFCPSPFGGTECSNLQRASCDLQPRCSVRSHGQPKIALSCASLVPPSAASVAPAFRRLVPTLNRPPRGSHRAYSIQ